MIEKVEKNYIDGIFKNYKITKSDGRVWLVPLAEDNTDYQAIQEWIADGNTVIDNKPE
jgi:hypothetical protein|tara:strand:- start:333 stop:506 length:174 start_codon:yes stop_codon:yes gene_type:complete